MLKPTHSLALAPPPPPPAPLPAPHHPQRVMELVEREMANRKYHALEGIKSVSQRDFTVEEAKGAAEVMCVGSTIGVIPVTHWDEHPIGDGTGGLATVALR